MYRNIYDKINKLMALFAAVAIIDALQVGKTTLAQSLRPEWLYLDLKRPSDFDRIDRDPEFLFQQHPVT